MRMAAPRAAQVDDVIDEHAWNDFERRPTHRGASGPMTATRSASVSDNSIVRPSACVAAVW